MNRYIAVMGTMGCGKTTAARLIADKLKYTLLEENFAENAFLPKFYADMQRWAFHSQTFFLMEKITQTLKVDRLRSRHPVIQDTPIFQDVHSYAQALQKLGRIDKSEWRLYFKIFRTFEPYFPKLDLIIFLDTSLTAVQSRIASRGRDFETKIDPAYLKLLDKLNREWLFKQKKVPVFTITTDNLNIVNNISHQKEFLRQVKKRILC